MSCLKIRCRFQDRLKYQQLLQTNSSSKKNTKINDIFFEISSGISSKITFFLKSGPPENHRNLIDV